VSKEDLALLITIVAFVINTIIGVTALILAALALH
jgi:hypothetical protein